MNKIKNRVPFFKECFLLLAVLVLFSSYTSSDFFSKEPFLLPMPSFEYTNNGSQKKVAAVVFQKIAEQANNIIDQQEWLKTNNLSLPLYTLPGNYNSKPTELPAGIPTYYNELKLIKAINYTDNKLLVYGKNFREGNLLAITNAKGDSLVHFLDFSNYAYAPKFAAGEKMFVYQQIEWAKIENGILYISHSHPTYAASSYNMNAYITAIDLKNYNVLWRSKPLVSNAGNFEITGDVIVCGYGFTAEPDYLYALNKYTGEMIQQVKVASGPEYIIRKDNKFYIRTYNTDYVFTVK